MNRSRIALAAFFVAAGANHFANPRAYEAIVPPALAERKREINLISGAAEIAGGLAVAHPATHRLGRWWLLVLLAAVFPANVQMALSPERVPGLDLKKIPRWALWARLPLQPLAMAWVWRATR